MTYSSRIAALEATVKAALPSFHDLLMSPTEIVVLHQDAFAADLQAEELTLLGAAIKLAGHYGKELHIIGKNRETCENSDAGT